MRAALALAVGLLPLAWAQETALDRDPAPFRLVPAARGTAVRPRPGKVEEGVTALRWLASVQGEDGGWASPDGRRDVATTALALLAFSANRHTQRFGPHKRHVDAGLRWLLRAQREDGWLGPAEADPLAILDHALATRALCDALLRSHDRPLLLAPARAAVARLLAARAPDGGFGLSRPGAASNALCTAYGLLALEAAAGAGLAAPPAVMADLARALDGFGDDAGEAGMFAPGDALSVTLDDSDPPRVPLLVAAVAAARAIAVVGDDPRLAAHAARLAPPDGLQDEPAYYHLGLRAERAAGALTRARANAWFMATLALQEPDGGCRAAGLWGAIAGRVGATAECVLALEVYYDHLQER